MSAPYAKLPAWADYGLLPLINADSEHRFVGRHAADSDAEAVMFFGEELAAAYDAAMEGSSEDEDRFWWTADFDELEKRVRARVREGDLVLLKGSRSVELERLNGVLNAAGG